MSEPVLDGDSEMARSAADLARALVTSHFEDFVADLIRAEPDPLPLWLQTLADGMAEIQGEWPPGEYVAALVGSLLTLTSTALGLVAMVTKTPPDKAVEKLVGRFATEGFTFS